MEKKYLFTAETWRGSKLFFVALFLLLLIVVKLNPSPVSAQIWEPEGLNMPGAWNMEGINWINPPTNPAFASSTKVTGGRIAKIAVGIPRYQTIFSVDTTGGDVVGGTYEWLFTSGPTATPWANTWRRVTVTMNTLQEYPLGGSGNNTITIRNGFWYTMNWQDAGYDTTRAIFMETSDEPVHITAVSMPAGPVANQPVDITIATDRASSAEELLFVRYTTNDWATSTLAPISVMGTSGIAQIPGMTAGTTVSYYVLSTTIPNITADHDLFTIRLNNNSGTNYSYTVATPPPAITWANLQWPASDTIQVGNSVKVYAQVYADRVTNHVGMGTGMNGWIGYSTSNTNPASWDSWIPATFAGDVGNNDEFSANIGSSITSPGTYYFASRFQLDGQGFVYGGFTPTGGGLWDGTTNVSGVLTVSLPTSVIETDLSKILIYPNPVRDKLEVSSKIPVSIIVADLNGKAVITDLTTATRHIIDFSGLPNGVYFIRLTSEQHSETRKIIKN